MYSRMSRGVPKIGGKRGKAMSILACQENEGRIKGQLITFGGLTCLGGGGYWQLCSQAVGICTTARLGSIAKVDSHSLKNQVHHQHLQAS